MPHIPHLTRTALTGIGATALAGGMLVGLPQAAQAHGSVSSPPSRVYTCAFLDPTSPLCQTAWKANPQAMYDWMEINLGQANGDHRALIPDGQLCSAGRAKYAAFDTPSAAWPVTNLHPDATGKYNLTWANAAPHATKYYEIYLTKPDFDPTQPLRWSDLELVHSSGPRPSEAHAQMSMNLPARTGHHIMFSIWQRSDSPEAFYSCSDVALDGSGIDRGAPLPGNPAGLHPNPTSSATANPSPNTGTGSGHHHSPTPTPTATQTPPPPVSGTASLIPTITSDWGSGFCANVRVSTTSSQPVTWSAPFDPGGTMSSLWGARSAGSGTSLRVQGESWNSSVSANLPTSFGYCATRTPTPTQPASPVGTSGIGVQVVTRADWEAGRTVDVTVRNAGSTPATNWSVSIEWPIAVTQMWNASGGTEGGRIEARHESWNATLAPGASTTFGFNASTSGPVNAPKSCTAKIGTATAPCSIE